MNQFRELIFLATHVSHCAAVSPTSFRKICFEYSRLCLSMNAENRFPQERADISCINYKAVLIHYNKHSLSCKIG